MPQQLEYVQDGDWERVRRNADTTGRLLSPPVPQARVYNNANISLVNNTDTVLTFNTERWDNGGLHSTTSNTGRLTAPITGLYSIGAGVRFASNATGNRYVYIRLNGTLAIAFDIRAAVNGLATSCVISADLQMVAGDYVEVVASQNSGGALNVESVSASSPEFWMHRVAGYINQGV